VWRTFGTWCTSRQSFWNASEADYGSMACFQNVTLLCFRDDLMAVDSGAIAKIWKYNDIIMGALEQMYSQTFLRWCILEVLTKVYTGNWICNILLWNVFRSLNYLRQHFPSSLTLCFSAQQPRHNWHVYKKQYSDCLVCTTHTRFITVLVILSHNMNHAFTFWCLATGL
jgi:hypothetical protein